MRPRWLLCAALAAALNAVVAEEGAEQQCDRGAVLLQLSRPALPPKQQPRERRQGRREAEFVGRPARQRRPPVYAEAPWHLSEWASSALWSREDSLSLVGSAEDKDSFFIKGGDDSKDDQAVVVFYTHGFFGDMDRQELKPEACELPCVQARSPDDKWYDKADALMTFELDYDPPRNARGAPAVAHTMESHRLYGWEFAGRYNATSSTPLTSTVPWPYFDMNAWHRLQARYQGANTTAAEFPGWEDREPAAVFVARNCDGERRNELIAALAYKGVRVDSISDCRPGRTGAAWPSGVDKKDKMGALRRYRVYLALENVAEPGYVTEKIMDGYAAGAVNVYLGAPDVTDYVPAGSFVDASAFDRDAASFDAVVEKIKKAIEDKVTWESYMAWRSSPPGTWSEGRLQKLWAWSVGPHSSGLCRACRFAWAWRTPGAHFNQATQQIEGKQPPPRGSPEWAAWRKP